MPGVITVLRPGARLCAESFGAENDPTLLLIAGAGSPMDWWDEEFCQQLAGGGRRVVRYDHRDTGGSTSYPVGRPGYSFADLCDDALAVADAFGAARFHAVGVSMGGSIAQTLAVTHPERLLSLTLMATSPAGPGTPDNGLPPMAPRLQEAMRSPLPEPDWADREAVVQYLVDGQRQYAGSTGFDEERDRVLAAHIVDRTSDIAAALTNHFLIDGGEDSRPRLGEIRVPTLVVHGTEDPLFPIGHAEALAREIPGARLLRMEGVGHQVPPKPLWDTVIPRLLRHTAAA